MSGSAGEPGNHASERGRRWAEALLRLYPSRFRRRYRGDFVRLFASDWQRAAAHAAGRSATVRRGLARGRLVADGLAHAALEHLTRFAPLRSRLGRRLGLDVAAAVRDLWRAPGFSALCVVTLAVAIGVNATLFTVIESVVLRPLPYAEPDRLAVVRVLDADGEPFPGLTLYEFRSLERRRDLFAGVGGIRPNYGEVLPIELDVTGMQQPEKLQGVEVTPGLLPLLGISPALGRAIGDDDRDGDDGQTLGFMLSHEYWTRAFAAEAGAIGATLTVEHRPKSIVGVLPPGVRLLFGAAEGIPERADLWTRTYRNVDNAATAHYMRTVVRLRDGVNLEQARAATGAMAATWFSEHPEAYDGAPPRVQLALLQHDFVASARPLLGTLVAAVALVLLIACANVGSLILARSRARERDLAVRRALGASEARIGRLILFEALVLALLGAVGGVALAASSVGGIRRLATDVLPRAADIGLGASTAAVAVALALGSGTIAALLAILQGRRGALVDRLRQGARLAGSRRGERYRDLLTVFQTAIAVVLLVAAGLMLRTLSNLAGVELGFDPDPVVTFKVEMDQTQIPLGPPRYEFFRDMAVRVASEPEVESASAIFVLPTHGGFGVDRYGRTVAKLESGDHRASFNVVLPGYFDTMGIDMLAGRDFDPEWPDGDEGEVIIDALIAAELWPGGDAVGRTLWIDFDMQNPQVRDRVHARVVGVAAHTRQDGVRRSGRPQIYVPHWHRPFWGMSYVARVAGAASGAPAVAAVAGAAQRAVEADPDAIFMHSARPLTAVVAEASHDGRLLWRALGVFSCLALMLAATGLYGVISYAARQRTREIGIRRAAGAQTRDVVWLVVRGALRLSSAGVVSGVAIAAVVSRLLTSLLFGVTPADPTTYIVAAAVLFTVGLAATAYPALRASAVDPVQALRSE